MILGVASGKGGTGKTTVTLNLARVASGGVQVLDCDVEEPNTALFFDAEVVAEEVVSIPVPRVDEAKCDACGECGKACQFNAIVSYGTIPLVFPDLCHGCGACSMVCPRDAIVEEPHRIGTVTTYRAGSIELIQGRLDVGAPMASPVIRAVRRRQAKEGLVLIDAPPGTSCSTVSALRGVDFVLLVTEPTVFGLHDLRLIVQTTRELGLPAGVVVNRMGSGDMRVHEYCRTEGLPVLAEIPNDRKIAEAYSEGRLLVEALSGYEKLFRDLLSEVSRQLEAIREKAPRATEDL